ncbi:universal stress protein [Streptomyces rectiverticillatus]|uniref:universal stress protein n=1 Tax=Streptomyces rectiverticillatus TaxID=173860 RepID=UPI0015C351CC|nr:universal stress protein [Streptomyces rectiverticillatus]QLE70378.1 universal stress protein [Streptomyces rectiverticillatus]
MEFPLVVGVDGSDGSLVALDWAVEEAARFGLSLRVVHASLWERYEGPVPSFGGDERPADELVAERVIAVALQRAGQLHPDVKVDAVTVPSDAVDALVDESRRAAALVTGSSGRGVLRGMLLGSVSLAVAGRAHCPVTVVRGEQRNIRGTAHKVVVGVEEGEEAAAAVRFALREAEGRGCEVEAVRAWRAPQQPTDPLMVLDDSVRVYAEQATDVLEEVLGAAQSEYPRVTIRRTVVEGPAHKALLQPSADADLLVLGASRRPDHRGLHLGRVSHTALHHAACPVAVVPHG